MVYNLHRLSMENDHPFAKGKKIIQNIENIFKRETHNWENRNWAPCQGILAVSWSDPCNPGLQHRVRALESAPGPSHWRGPKFRYRSSI